MIGLDNNGECINIGVKYFGFFLYETNKSQIIALGKNRSERDTF